MRSLRVVGLSPDGTVLLLRDEHDEYEVPLDEVPLDEVTAARRRAVRSVQDARSVPAPSPRQIQERIRRGESAFEIAEQFGLPVAAVARWEGPVLAEREHHAASARGVAVGDRTVEEHVQDHVQRMVQDPPPVVWDSWQTDPGRWEVRARAGRVLVRLAWHPAARRVTALDDLARVALGLLPAEEDVLSAVLRPVAARPAERPLGARLAVPGAEEEHGTAGEEHGTAALPFTEEERVDPAGAPPAAPAATSAGAETAQPAAVRPRPARTGSTRAAGRPKRASVPNWDDITSGFGGRPPGPTPR